MADYRSNTMELNSILEEARSRKSGASAKAAPAQSASARKSSAPARAERSFDDDFVLTDDSYSARAPKNQAQKPSSDPRSAAAPKKKTGLIVTLCIIGVLVLAGLGGLTLWLTSGEKAGPDGSFSDNVYLNGKSLKDMNMDQARALAATIEEDLANAIKVDVKAGDKTFSYTKDNFKYSFDTETVLAQAKAYSEEKGIKTEDKQYEIKMTIDESSCSEIITAVAEEVKTDAEDAKVTGFDPSADPMFTYEDETTGTALDEKASLTALTDFIKEGKVVGTVDATVTEVKPAYTVEYLKDNIVELSHFSTISTNNANGNENMRVSLAACNGSVIEPGATWSFNDCTGNSNLESNGYKPAGVIVNGKHETGIGGGICQSSTTIYNAAILCGMDVVERACHYYKSVYVDAGRDATIDYGNIDLKVSNPFKYQLFMKCWMDGTELNCTIYGLRNTEFDEVRISTTDPSYFDRGYKVYTSRTFLKDGEEVRSDDLPSSTYYTSAPSSGSDSGSRSDDDNDDTSSASTDNNTSTTAPETPDPEPAAPDPEPEVPVTPDPEPEVPDAPAEGE